MSETKKSWVKPALSISLLVLSALGLVNVYADNAEVAKRAAGAACDGCETHLVQLSRSPVAQTFHFQLVPSREVAVVECSREFVFVGEYACAKRP